MSDPVASYLDALDEWGRWLFLLYTCDPAATTEREHREQMVRRCRSNLEVALRLIVGHAQAAAPGPHGPHRSPSVRIAAVRDPRREPDDPDDRDGR